MLVLEMNPTTEHEEKKASISLILGVVAVFAIFAPMEIGWDPFVTGFFSSAWTIFYTQQNGFSFSLIGPAE